MKGHVRRRGRAWAYWVELGPDPSTGKRRQRSRSGFKTQKEATAAMRDLIRSVETGAVRVGETPTLAEFVLDEWLPSRREALRPSTWAGYRQCLEGRVLPRLGALRLDRITPKHIGDLYDELLASGGRDQTRSKGLSARTVSYTGMVLNRVFADAVKRGLIARNPAEHVERPTPKTREMDWWSIDDARRFLAHVEGDRLEPLWQLMLTTGMRRGEALGLRWDDIDLDAGRLAVRRTLVAVEGRPAWSEPKTAASRRVIALDPTAVGVLRNHRRRQLEERMAMGAGYSDDGLVFATVSGGVLHPDNVSRSFERAVKSSNVRRIRLHDLRHTAATTMLDQGVPLKVVAERLGHSSTRITADLYQHVSETMQDDAAAKLGAAFLGGARNG